MSEGRTAKDLPYTRGTKADSSAPSLRIASVWLTPGGAIAVDTHRAWLDFPEELTHEMIETISDCVSCALQQVRAEGLAKKRKPAQ